MTKDELLEKANSLPLAPGVYLMHGKDGEVIYVGKAKKLKNRVSQYFQAGRGHNLKTHTMVGLVHDFDTIIVGSEFEALVLENALIKQYMPRYNILCCTCYAGKFKHRRTSCIYSHTFQTCGCFHRYTF